MPSSNLCLVWANTPSLFILFVHLMMRIFLNFFNNADVLSVCQCLQVLHQDSVERKQFFRSREDGAFHALFFHIRADTKCLLCRVIVFGVVMATKYNYVPNDYRLQGTKRHLQPKKKSEKKKPIRKGRPNLPLDYSWEI